MDARISAIIPTYNEVQNIVPLIDSLCRVLSGADFELIIVDDSSPDGTWLRAAELALQNPRIRLIKRQGRAGLAAAILDGMKASTGEYVAMMDADFSHRPEDLLRLLSLADKGDIVVGSRYVPGAQVERRNLFRRLYSFATRALARFLLGVRIQDPTSGFAVFRRQSIEPILTSLHPKGFKLLLEILILSPGAVVVEAPVTFQNRRKGTSKFGLREVWSFMCLCLDLRGRQRRLKI